MAIEIQQSPLAAVLSQTIGTIPQMVQGGYERNLLERQQQLSEQQFQMSAAQTALSMDNQRLQQMEYIKANMMDAAGYNNPAIETYFRNLQYQKGKLNINPNFSSGWEWTGKSMFPTKDQAYAEYQTLAEASAKPMKQSDDKLFDAQWSKTIESRTNRVLSEIAKLKQAGISDTDIKVILSENPELRSNIKSLYADDLVTPEIKAQLGQFAVPSKHEFNREVLAGAGLGGMMASKYLATTPADIIKSAEAKSAKYAARFDKQIDTQKEQLDKHKKTKGKGKFKTIENKQNKMDSIKKKIDKLRGKKTSHMSKLSKAKASMIKQGTNFRRWGLNKPIPSAMLLGASGWGLGALGKMAGGTKGEALGRFGGGVIQGLGAATAGGRAMKGLGGILKKTLAKRGATAAGMSMMDAGLPIMDILALGYLGAGAWGDIKESAKLWKLSQQGF